MARSILQILLFRDEKASRELDRALWAAFKEVESFYNEDQHRAVFRRFYLSETQPASWLDTAVWGRWKDLTWAPVKDELWKQARGRFSRTYDQKKLAELVEPLLGIRGPETAHLIVTDQELTPPEKWRYIIWDDIPDGGMVSVAPTDPRYWRQDDPDRVATIKHRIRTACLCMVGELLGLRRCENESCFLYGPVDSVLRLDEMVCLGEEHNIPKLARRGFAIRGADPNDVQSIIDISQREGAVS